MIQGLPVTTRSQEGTLCRLGVEESPAQTAPRLDFSTPELHHFLWFEAPGSMVLCFHSLGNYTHVSTSDVLQMCYKIFSRVAIDWSLLW